VPYRIKSYQEIKSNPKDTITFDFELNNKIDEDVNNLGADGRLLMIEKNSIYHVNLTEKILVTLLAKLSNFIPEAGIWLNTQRPEWNDANNALVGNGVSMVTLYYLRRFLKFWHDKFTETPVKSVQISSEVKELFDRISSLFSGNAGIIKHGFTNRERLYFTDKLGEAGTIYRNTIYEFSFSGKKESITTNELSEFITLALQYIDQSIKVNKRDDGLYHAYNLISFKEKELSIRHLYEMLEGQVAVLSSGLLSVKESLDVMNALKDSALFRTDQYSYLLYPDRELPRFIEKNNIPAQYVKESKLLTKLIADQNTSIINTDDSGNFHFNGSFRNADVLNRALDQLDDTRYGRLVGKEKTKILEVYEIMFDHQSFTGRSGTFYGYEGLGSIYWHMVSKLLLAVEECFFKALDENADNGIIGEIKDHYYEIKAGIGLYKSPELYGAFPTDPYSHTPRNSGVKQPGMTGQVKEDFISRMGEIGFRVKEGQIEFIPRLINKNEFLNEEDTFEYYTVEGKKRQLVLHEKQLGFTICQVPVIYNLTPGSEKIIISFTAGNKEEIAGNSIDRQTSNMVFNRNNKIELIEVFIN
jgi:hypothetical protein